MYSLCSEIDIPTVVAADAKNVVLNRPTFASSVYNDPLFGGDYVSSRAVDGNNDPDALKVDNSCFNSDDTINPWWAVDLGAAFTVVGVLFTNRGNGYGNVSTHAQLLLHCHCVTWHSM